MQRGIEIFHPHLENRCIIELILGAMNAGSYSYTNGVSFDNNSFVDLGIYNTNDLLRAIRENGGNVQETTIWVTNEQQIPQPIPHSYDDLLRSDFCAIVDIYDFDHIDVYAKNQAFIESLTEMIAIQSPTSHIHIVTDKNDYRTGF